MLRVRLLGDFDVVYLGKPVIAMTRERVRALFAYLLLQRGRTLSRQEVAFQFWPDSTEKQAQTNLRNLLAKLKDAFPALEAYLQADRSWIQWRMDAPLVIDVAEFEQALAEGASAGRAGEVKAQIAALQRAVALYRGDLLPHAYDDWVLAARQRLRDQFIAALEWLIMLCKEQADFTTAIDYAQRLLAQDPLYEAAYRCLIELYDLNGDWASARRTYRACAEILERELGVAPSPATQAVLRQMRIDHASPALAADATALLESLVAAWGQATPGAAYFWGASGFLARLAASLIDRGMLDDAQRVLDHAFQIPANGQEAYWIAELHHVQARLWWRQGRALAQVEAGFQRAIQAAQRQNAGYLHLRAAAGYSEFLHAQGRDAQAEAVLKAIWSRFIPGAIPIHRDALQRLLDELG